MNLASTVIPKSDQLNADDLISSPRTIRITAVKSGSTPEQPVSIFYEGDAGRPYKPCKSMRRILISIWGDESSAYVGRSLTLFRDPNVRFGSDETGGIRISHASDIEEAMTIALTVTRGKRKPYRVEKLVVKALAKSATAPSTAEPASPQPDELLDRDAILDIGATKAAGGIGALKFWWSEELTTRQRKLFPEGCPKELKDRAEAVTK